MNQLIPISTDLAVNEEHFNELISSSDFLPRVQLYGSSSTAVKEEKIGQGRFGLTTKDDITDLGKQFDCLPVNVRFKAMEMSGSEIERVSHDPHSAAFMEIQARAEEGENQGYMFGVEFLLWIPQLQTFATYFLSNKSSRREAKPLKGMLGKATTIEAKLVKWKEWAFHAPKVLACSTPFDVPDLELINKESAKFRAAKEYNVSEKASTTEAKATERAR